MKLSVKAWQLAIGAAARKYPVWAASADQCKMEDPVTLLGILFHEQHVEPYCRKYKRKYHPQSFAEFCARPDYWRDRDERSKYADDPAWRDGIMQLLQTYPPGFSVRFLHHVPSVIGETYHRPPRFVRRYGDWSVSYEGRRYVVQPDNLFPGELFITPPADEDIHELANICGYIPLEEYLEQRTATISNEDGAGVLRRNDEAYSEGPREDRREHRAAPCA